MLYRAKPTFQNLLSPTIILASHTLGNADGQNIKEFDTCCLPEFASSDWNPWPMTDEVQK